MISIIRSETIEIAVVAAVLIPVVAVIGSGLSILVVLVGTIIGDWLTTKIGRIRSNSIGN